MQRAGRAVKRALGFGALVLAVAGAAWLFAPRDDEPQERTTAPTPVDAETVARGAYLARLGNCAGCHTAPAGAAYAGGRGIATPFGTVYAGNLTPDASGLGAWSADDFWRALHHGRSRDGRLLTPAFPYTAFTHVSRDDSDALWAYLRSLAPVNKTARPHELRFPYSTQAALWAWRQLYFRPGAPPSDAQRSAEWNRGAYLVRGLGHCAACHAPRNAWGAHDDSLSGGFMPARLWWAPSLLTPRGTDEQLIELLRSGQSAQGSALGPMAEVVRQSTQHWRDDDLRAVAVYLRSLPAGDTAPAAMRRAHPDGERLYADRCASCHGERGQGVPKIYPPLAGNDTVLQPTIVNLVQVLRHGGFAPATATHPRPFGMPPSELNEAQMADVLSYVRQSWGNDATAVSVIEVLRAR
jgi:mono/diheme cytochrome c family protein